MMRALLGAGLLLAPVFLSAQAPARAGGYDAYLAGVRIAELTVGPDGRTYTIRKRNPETNRWSAPHSAARTALEGDTAFALPGALRSLVSNIASIEAVPWNAVPSVGWPTASSIYVRARELEATVGGRTVKATHWALQDATRPLDLVIGPGNRFIAGVEPGADVVLVARGSEGFTTVGRWRDPKVSQPRFGYQPLGKIMVPMADGTKLATLVYLPDGPEAKGPFPVVFIRTPYGISNLIGGFWHYPARGYALVVQAVRGTSYGDPEYRSEGEWVPVINEPKDGAEALAWITKQPWSNGKVCMQGGSYVGYTQWAVSMAANPALKCVVPESSMGTTWTDQPYWGGTFVEGMAYYMFFMLDTSILPNRTWTEILHHRPLIELDDFATGKNIPQWNTMVEHWLNDDYWRQQDWYRSDTPRTFSALMISGWWDDDFPGTESNWALMQKKGRGPQRIVIGPWKHGYNVDRALNGYSFGPMALREDIWLTKQLWYDRFLKDVDNGVDRTTAEYFVLGSNEWRTASAWPPKEAQPTSWYFRSDGKAARYLTSGTLTRNPPPATEPADVYRYDPTQPPPNWMSFEQMMRWEDVQTFPHDFKDIEARPDVVTFTSAPLESDLTIAGDVKAILYASADVRDTDWWVHLSDVDERGRSNRITMGVIRARFRHLDDPQHKIAGENFTSEKLLSGDPKEIVKYEIGLRAIANTFKKGHRIRVAVMNAVDNYSFPNSNTGKNEATVTETVVGTMGIHHGPDAPSQIVLPVLR
jgi:putative CocE/NonD family hydrolase